MSMENVKKFLELVKTDEGLARKVVELKDSLQDGSHLKDEKEILAEKVLPLAKAHGLDFTADEFLAYANSVSGELSDDDLLNVSGGISARGVALGLLFATGLSFVPTIVSSFAIGGGSAPETAISQSYDAGDSLQQDDEIDVDAAEDNQVSSQLQAAREKVKRLQQELSRKKRGKSTVSKGYMKNLQELEKAKENVERLEKIEREKTENNKKDIVSEIQEFRETKKEQQEDMALGLADNELEEKHEERQDEINEQVENKEKELEKKDEIVEEKKEEKKEEVVEEKKEENKENELVEEKKEEKKDDEEQNEEVVDDEKEEVVEEKKEENKENELVEEKKEEEEEKEKEKEQNENVIKQQQEEVVEEKKEEEDRDEEKSVEQMKTELVKLLKDNSLVYSSKGEIKGFPANIVTAMLYARYPNYSKLEVKKQLQAKNELKEKISETKQMLTATIQAVHSEADSRQVDGLVSQCMNIISNAIISDTLSNQGVLVKQIQVKDKIDNLLSTYSSTMSKDSKGKLKKLKTQAFGATKEKLADIEETLKETEKTLKNEAEQYNAKLKELNSMLNTIDDDINGLSYVDKDTDALSQKYSAIKAKMSSEDLDLTQVENEISELKKLVEQAAKGTIDLKLVEFAGDARSWDGTIENLYNCLTDADFDTDRIENLEKWTESCEKALKKMTVDNDTLQIYQWAGTSCGSNAKDYKHKAMLKTLALFAMEDYKQDGAARHVKAAADSSLVAEDVKIEGIKGLKEFVDGKK